MNVDIKQTVLKHDAKYACVYNRHVYVVIELTFPKLFKTILNLAKTLFNITLMRWCCFFLFQV